MAEAARLLPQAIIIRRKIQTKWNLRGFKFGGKKASRKRNCLGPLAFLLQMIFKSSCGYKKLSFFSHVGKANC
jgi:hypothetical protein